MKDHPIFHEGELDAQRRAHEEEIASRVGRVIRPSIVPGAIPFIRQQPMVVAGSEDSRNRVWASVLYGRPGFLDPSVDAKRLRVHLDQIFPQPDDPLLGNLEFRPEVGLLVIELSTRRRLRINGPATISETKLVVEVGESYPVCPKYIQKRDVQIAENTVQRECSLRSGTALEAQHIAAIERADTFFVASSHAVHGPDVSHRGGNPGFVKVSEDGTFRIPDYQGNSMFSSLGNFLSNPRAGLIFTDYESRKVLQLTGEASVFWDQPDPENATGGTNRFWEFSPESWLETRLSDAIHERFYEYSPFNP